MTIVSNPLGSVTVTGDDAVAFRRKVSHSRGTKAAAESVAHGRKLVAEFALKNVVSVELKPEGPVKPRVL